MWTWQWVQIPSFANFHRPGETISGGG
jgi:hypothetical protein